MDIECTTDHGLNAPIAGKFRKGQVITVGDEVGSQLIKDRRWKIVGEKEASDEKTTVKTKKKEEK
jgi:hypothetical protein